MAAEAMAVNKASRWVMGKAGLRLVRTFHQPWPHPIEGDRFGDMEYALDKADWAARHDRWLSRSATASCYFSASPADQAEPGVS